jgi:hypothetical protein
MDHVGVVVDDLEVAVSFFVELGWSATVARHQWRATGWTPGDVIVADRPGLTNYHTLLIWNVPSLATQASAKQCHVAAQLVSDSRVVALRTPMSSRSRARRPFPRSWNCGVASARTWSRMALRTTVLVALQGLLH